MKDKVYAVVHVIAHEGKEKLLREALLALVANTRTEPGFIQYDLHEAVDKPGHFAFYEIWADELSLELHSNTDVIKAHAAKAGGWTKSIAFEKYKLIS